MAKTEAQRIRIALLVLASVVGMLSAEPLTPAGEQIYGAAATSASSAFAQLP